MQFAPLVLVSLLLSCGSSAERPEQNRSSANQASEATEEPAAEPVEPAESAWRGLDSVNLIGRIPLGIRVSTTTPSGRRGPCLLADGDLGTAWNSASGDDRAWIRFGLPSTSIITAFEMTPGYSADALFRANRRIRRVSVFHNAEPVDEFELNIESQQLQRFIFDPALQGGGSIEIRVEQFEPGTQSSWTEICVSEMRLWGVAQTMFVAAPICTVGEIGAEVETPPQRFGRLFRDARHSLSPDDQRNALLIAIDLMDGCSPTAHLRRRLSEVLRLPPDDEGRLPEEYDVFAREMRDAMRACGLDLSFQEKVFELINLRDDYDPD